MKQRINVLPEDDFDRSKQIFEVIICLRNTSFSKVVYFQLKQHV